MISGETLAALPGMAALIPASTWVAAAILVALAAVITVRLSLNRKTLEKRSHDIPKEGFWMDLLVGVSKSSEPEEGPENPGRKDRSQETRAEYPREHVP